MLERIPSIAPDRKLAALLNRGRRVWTRSTLVKSHAARGDRSTLPTKANSDGSTDNLDRCHLRLEDSITSGVNDRQSELVAFNGSSKIVTWFARVDAC